MYFDDNFDERVVFGYLYLVQGDSVSYFSRCNWDLGRCIFRHASVSSTYPCKSVGGLVRKSVSHTFGFPTSGQ